MDRINRCQVLVYCSVVTLMGVIAVQAQRPSPLKPLRSADEIQEKSAPDREESTRLILPIWPAVYPFEIRRIDETNNNLFHPDWGSADTELNRMCSIAYADGFGSPSQADCPSARAISNACVAQTGSIPNSHGVSDLFWQWGQFLDHDITLVLTVDPVEPFDIPVPPGDPYFDPFNTGTATIPLDRSFYNMVGGVRQQVNQITAYIDASNVYGSDDARAHALRRNDGTGRLKSSKGRLLPFNKQGLPNLLSTDPSFFLAGDIRANEQVYLTAMHTVFMREHNKWAKRIKKKRPLLGEETIYQMARAMVAAEIQCITYNEFLPILLGPDALDPYMGYRPFKNAGINNEFATAAYRVGHTFLSPELKRLDAQLQTIPEGNLPLADAFFSPDKITSIGIEPYLRGQSQQMAQEVDMHVVDGVRNFLFGPPGAGGFDLASLNIQRGRDHGLPSYAQVRIDLGLPPVTTFADVSSDPDVQNALASVYDSVDDIDLWVGGLAEDHVPGAMVGPTIYTILKRQFEALRDGDRFWYKTYLPPKMVRMVENRTLSKIIRTNTRIGKELQRNAFMVPNP